MKQSAATCMAAVEVMADRGEILCSDGAPGLAHFGAVFEVVERTESTIQLSQLRQSQQMKVAVAYSR